MIRHRLQRYRQSDSGTLGSLMGLATLEEEDRDNAPNEGRIPAGVYVCERAWYNGGGYETFEVTDVPNRTHILFHKGNSEFDTAGCILVGLRHGVWEMEDEETGEVHDADVVLESARGFRQFMDRLAGVERWELEIANPGDYPDPEIRLADSMGIGNPLDT